MRQKSIALTVILIIIVGCDKVDNKFPKTRELTEFQETEFLPTLEHGLSTNKNLIYCSTLLYAWDNVKKTIKEPLQIDSSLHDLILLNNSTSYVNTLKEDEYSTEGEVDGNLITVRAEFKKSLPFELELTSYTDKLVFKKTKVASFGTIGYEADDAIEILYYKDDNDFIIKLSPKDKEHEIVLLMTPVDFKSMAEMVSDIEMKSKIGQSERQDESSSWKYFITDIDEVIIPKLRFNIEANYSKLEGNKFQSTNLSFHIETAWQRTAFILDEKGSEIESETEIVYAVDSVAVVEERPKPKPKSMRFDKPFFLMLKRIDSNNPYFGLWTVNTELMVSE